MLMVDIFRGALQLNFTTRAANLPILQGLWCLLQLDCHGKGSPTSWVTIFQRDTLFSCGWFILLKQPS